VAFNQFAGDMSEANVRLLRGFLLKFFWPPVYL
jgi:hypothetical protein